MRWLVSEMIGTPQAFLQVRLLSVRKRLAAWVILGNLYSRAVLHEAYKGGPNLRYQASVLQYYIRQRYSQSGMPISKSHVRTPAMLDFVRLENSRS